MLKSMTGFGRYELSERKVIVEAKSVNHRYLDITIKMPKKFNCFESAIRNIVKDNVQRGKIDLFLSYESEIESNVTVQYNSMLAQEYMNCFQSIKEQFGVKDDISVSMIGNLPEVLTMKHAEENVEDLWESIKTATEEALKKLVETRISEGEQLKHDLLGKLDRMLELVQKIEVRSPVVVEEYRKRLEEKVRELLDTTIIDESRIVTEVTIFADKVCVDEEIVRLKSHILHTKEALTQQEGIGRKLDFIAQEMNREANTILSKSNDRELSDFAIELKTEIEKVREQIQNIE
ncbi:MAG: YicC family protein [Clostridiales bacterium]|nr:YicC family protein [Clostridiales bacterium]